MARVNDLDAAIKGHRAFHDEVGTGASSKYFTTALIALEHERKCEIVIKSINVTSHINFALHQFERAPA